MLLETTPSVHNRTYQLDQRGGGGRIRCTFNSYTLVSFDIKGIQSYLDIIVNYMIEESMISYTHD